MLFFLQFYTHTQGRNYKGGGITGRVPPPQEGQNLKIYIRVPLMILTKNPKKFSAPIGAEIYMKFYQFFVILRSKSSNFK